MNQELVSKLYKEIDNFPIFDPHTHLDANKPSAGSLGKILSYHYYTELCNSAEYEEGWWNKDLSDDELVRRISKKLPLIHNTIQFSWFLTLASEFLGVSKEDLHDAKKLIKIHEDSKKIMSEDDYFESVIEKSKLQRVYLTNQYNEKLEGFDTSFYRPCLRIDPFSYFVEKGKPLQEISETTGIKIEDAKSFDDALDRLFKYFSDKNFAYASVSSWPNTNIHPVDTIRESAIIKKIIAEEKLSQDEHEDHVSYSFITVTKLCRKYNVPFHLMIGVDKDVYSHGVLFGTDLVNSVNSMRGYDYLFNTFPDVKFPTSVLSDTQGLELTSSAWIRHNVYPSGHWWYSNNPVDIERELARRLDVVPLLKLIGYYSDAYYIEFILPKFKMYKYSLSKVLAERIESSRIDPNMEELTVDKALEIAWKLLIENPKNIFNDK